MSEGEVCKKELENTVNFKTWPPNAKYDLSFDSIKKKESWKKIFFCPIFGTTEEFEYELVMRWYLGSVNLVEIIVFVYKDTIPIFWSVKVKYLWEK